MSWTPINKAIHTEVLAASIAEDEQSVHLSVIFSGVIERPGKRPVVLAGETHAFKLDLKKVVVDSDQAGEPRFRADFEG